MTKFSNAKIAFILAVCLMGVVFAAPNFMGQKHLDSFPEWLQPVNLGLDLQGGSHLLLEVKADEVIRERLISMEDAVRDVLREERIRYDELTTADKKVSVKILDGAQVQQTIALLDKLDKDVKATEVSDNYVEMAFTEQALIQLHIKTMDQSIEIVRRRVDEMGTREPSIQKQGKNRILVQLPGVENPEHIKRMLGKTAKLTFHFVDDRSSVSDAKRGRLSAGSKLMGGSAGARSDMYVVERRVVVGGEHLTDSQPTYSEGEPVVSFSFDSFGAKKFGEATGKNIGRNLAIVLDGEVISAPTVQGRIMGDGVITGSFTVESANDLSMLLRAGALPAPLEVLEERTVGPGLGADSIRAGSIACVVGLVLVVVFIVLAYGLMGCFTTAALFVNMFMLLGLLSFLDATLTLPGIAGIVLTMGMAVDANVLIFERMREEVNYGRSPFNAAEAGFKNAFVTILDANITTMVAALVLFQFGSGPVRGFAVTLGLGILTSLFTAIMVTRLIVVTWLRRKRPETLPI